MGAKELDKNQMVIEASRVEYNSLVIGSGEIRNLVTYLDHPAGLNVLRTDVNGEREKKANEYGHGGWHRPYEARTFYVSGKPQYCSGQKNHYEPGAIIGQIDLSGKIKPDHNGTKGET